MRISDWSSDVCSSDLDRIAVCQDKTGALVDIPIHPELKRVLEGTPRQNMTFLVTEYGKPFTANGFGNWMRDRYDEAGLPQCSSHGLRKAMAKRLAEAGCSLKEIMSITGPATEGEVILYTDGKGVALGQRVSVRVEYGGRG